MATEVSSQNGFHQASPVRYPKLQQLMQAAQQGKESVMDGALQTSIGPLVSATLGLNLLGVGNGFPGYSVPGRPDRRKPGCGRHPGCAVGERILCRV